MKRKRMRSGIWGWTWVGGCVWGVQGEQEEEEEEDDGEEGEVQEIDEGE